MGFLSENCALAPLTQQLHDALTGFDCQREPGVTHLSPDTVGDCQARFREKGG